MTSKHLLELWDIRFRKLEALEEDSHGFYQRLLDENSEAFSHIHATSPMEEVIRDEVHHTRIARLLRDMIDKKRAGTPS